MSKYVKKDLKSLVASLKKETEQSDNNSSDNKQNRFWRPVIEDTDTSVEYVIRFLPSENEDYPWTKMMTHMFKYPNGNYVSFNCPKKHKIGDGKCQLCDEVSEIYDSENQTKIKSIASRRYAKARYMTNILVVKDPRDNGANEGKVFLYAYGKQIFEILKEEIMDEDDGCLFYDPEDGADFKLKIEWTGSGKDKYQSYLKSKFINKGSVTNLKGEDLDEEAIDKLMEQRVDVTTDILAPDKFWSNEQIIASLDQQKYVSKADLSKDSTGDEVTAPKKEKEVEDTPPPKKEKEKEKEKPDVDVSGDDDDDDLDDLLNDL
jgi:hypothetical protein